MEKNDLFISILISENKDLKKNKQMQCYIL